VRASGIADYVGIARRMGEIVTARGGQVLHGAPPSSGYGKTPKASRLRRRNGPTAPATRLSAPGSWRTGSCGCAGWTRISA
jgi:hypothetical protein